MVSPGILCLAHSMRTRFVRRLRSTETQPPPNPAGIRIRWVEDPGNIIQIQVRDGGLAAKLCEVPLKPMGSQDQPALSASAIKLQRLFTLNAKRRAA